MFPGKRGRTLAAAVFAVACAIVATCSVLPSALAQSAPVSYGPTAFTQNGAMPQIPLTGTGFDKCSVTLSAVSGQILVQPYAMQNGSWVRVINQGGIAFAGTYPGPVSSTTYTAFYVGVTVNSGGVTVSETCWSSTAPTPTPSSAGQNVSIVNPLDSTGAVRVGGTFTGTVTVGVPTVIPSCPAASYPCGLPTPIPTGSPYPAPIPTPAGGIYPVICSSYPCGFPTPIPTGSPYPAPTTSPFATFSPYPGGAVVLTGPSTAPAASAGTYAVCVDSSGRLCVQTPAPTFTANQTVSGTVTANQGTSPWVISGTVTSTTPSPCATAASGVCKVDIASQSLSPVVVSTPSAGPAPTASAGAAIPSAAVQTLAQILCAYTTGTVSITAGNTYTARCDSLGNIQVTFPSAQPVTIANASAMPVTTPAPCATPTCNSVVWQGTSPWVDSTPSAAPAATATAGAAPPAQAPFVNSIGHCYVVAGGTQVITGGNIGTIHCNSSGAQFVIGTAGNATDGQANSTPLNTTSGTMGFNGTTWDRSRKDTYAAGPMWFTDGGALTATVATGAGNTVIKGTPGRLARVTITTAGTTGNTTCYDNATTNSGTILAQIDGTTAIPGDVAGVTLDFQMPAANGITCAGAANSPALTISYW